MRKALRWTVRIAVVGALGWSALWYAGRHQLDSMIDDSIAMLGAQGLSVEYAAKKIGGYPFGFTTKFQDVTLRDTASGLVTVLPTLEGAADVTAPTRLVARMPERFEVALPVPPEIRARDPRLPETFDFEIESEGLVMTGEGLPGMAQRLTARAERMLIIHAGPDKALNLALEVEGLDANAKRPAAAEAGPATSTVRLAAFDLLMVMPKPGGGATNFDATGRNFALSGETDLFDPRALGALLAGGPRGRAEMALSAGPVDARLALSGVSGAAQPAPNGVLALSAGVLSGVLEIGDGLMELRLGADHSTLRVTPEDDDNQVRGAITASLMEALYRVPLGPSEEMKPIGLKLSLVNLEPDAELWATLDNGAALPRHPGQISIDIDGTGRFVRLPQGLTGQAPPLELRRISINKADVTALGANATASGDLAFRPPYNAPEGTVEVRLNGALALLRQLHLAKLISQEDLQYLATMTALYTRAGKGSDELVADIAMDAQGILVNGQRMQ